MVVWWVSGGCVLTLQVGESVLLDKSLTISVAVVPCVWKTAIGQSSSQEAFFFFKKKISFYFHLYAFVYICVSVCHVCTQALMEARREHQISGAGVPGRCEHLGMGT